MRSRAARKRMQELLQRSTFTETCRRMSVLPLEKLASVPPSAVRVACLSRLDAAPLHFRERFAFVFGARAQDAAGLRFVTVEDATVPWQVSGEQMKEHQEVVLLVSLGKTKLLAGELEASVPCEPANGMDALVWNTKPLQSVWASPRAPMTQTREGPGGVNPASLNTLATGPSTAMLKSPPVEPTSCAWRRCAFRFVHETKV